MQVVVAAVAVVVAVVPLHLHHSMAPLLSSDGSTIGSLTGKTAFSVDLQASNTTAINGKKLHGEHGRGTVPAASWRRKARYHYRISRAVPGFRKEWTASRHSGMVNISKHAPMAGTSSPVRSS